MNLATGGYKKDIERKLSEKMTIRRQQQQQLNMTTIEIFFCFCFLFILFCCFSFVCKHDVKN